MKKKIAYLLTSVLLFQTAGYMSVQAADSDNSWKISYYGEFEDEAERETYVADITNAAAYDGDMSLNVKCPLSRYDENSRIEISNTLMSNLETGNYTLEFYARKNSKSLDGEVHIGDTVISMADMNIAAVDAPSGEDGWKKYSYSFDYTAKSTSDFSFVFNYRIISYTIDEISLVLTGTDVNLIGDPGFEQYFDESTIDDKEEAYDTQPYQAKTFMYTKLNDGVSISWKNPSTDTLSEIQVYNISSGELVLVSDEIPTDPERVVYFIEKGLISGMDYTYKIVFSYTDKEDYIYYMGGQPSPKVSSMKFGAWTFENEMGGAAGYTPSNAYIDTTEAHSGEASFKMYMNSSLLSSDGMAGNIFMKLWQTVPLEAGKTYKIGFWIKGEEVGSNVCANMRFDLFNGMYGRDVVGSKGTYDWKYVEYRYTYGLDDAHDQNIFLMHYEGYAKGIWVDDVECHEVNEDDEAIGENLFINSGFEELNKAATAEIQKLTAEPVNNGISFSWKNVGSDCCGINIYQKIFDEYEYRGTLESGITAFTMTSLEPGAEYTFKFVPYNTEYLEGESVEITQKTLIADYIIDMPVLTYGGIETDNISNAGTYKISVSAKNNALEDGLDFEIIAFLYNADNTPVKAYSTKASVVKRHEKAPYTTKSLLVNVPEGNGQYMEVYVLDSRGSLSRYYDTVIYGADGTETVH